MLPDKLDSVLHKKSIRNRWTIWKTGEKNTDTTDYKNNTEALIQKA